jgi:ADP-ribose pyrophosphatase YjhB (NUDIX family)
VVIADRERGVLLALRDIEPCIGNWHLPGETVRFGEPVLDAVRRLAVGELGLVVEVGELLGSIEYPSHYNNGLDSPVGLAFRARPTAGLPADDRLPPGCRWFTEIPTEMHDEQQEFLAEHLGLSRNAGVG